MPRILAIDYGTKRCGVAVTDPLQIIANGLETVDTTSINSFILEYCKSEAVEKILIGWPLHPDGNETKLNPIIRKFVDNLILQLPEIKFEYVNEEFSSVKAKQFIIQSGAKKKVRADKSLVDKISAVVLLQEYLGHI